MKIINQENGVTDVFNTQAFLKKRSRSTNQPEDPMVTPSNSFLACHPMCTFLLNHQ